MRTFHQNGDRDDRATVGPEYVAAREDATTYRLCSEPKVNPQCA